MSDPGYYDCMVSQDGKNIFPISVLYPNFDQFKIGEWYKFGDGKKYTRGNYDKANAFMNKQIAVINGASR